MLPRRAEPLDRRSDVRFKSHQWNYQDAERDSGWRITGHPLNAIIDNGRCNLGHEWDEGFNADCGLCTAVRDAMDIILRGEL